MPRPPVGIAICLCCAGCAPAYTGPVQVLSIWPPPVEAPPPLRPTRFGADCEGVVAPPNPSDTTTDFHPARGMVMIPPMPVPRSMRGQTLTVQIRYNAEGVGDSVVIAGGTDGKYVESYRKAIIRGLKNRPNSMAIYKGCGVMTWQLTDVTLAK